MKASGIFKLSTLALLTTAAMGANAAISADTAQGTFAVSGDVEFDNTYQATTSATNVDATTIGQDGRVLVGVSGNRQVGDNYIKANVQLLAHMSNAVDADDAWVAFGAENDWEVKLGRFEATNLFPTGQDTVLYHAAGVTVYNADDARGRNSMGEVALTKMMGKAKVELAVTPKAAVADDTNAVFLRPVVSVALSDAFTVTAGAEFNPASDDYDYTGYGATVNYSADMLSVNVNYAYKDQDLSQTSMAVNAQYGNAFIGYVNAVNETTGADAEVNTFYASYKFANIMDVEDLSLYAGASTSEVKDSDAKDTSVRLRVKYLF